ncbi:MAG: hypothetical protein WC538_22215 [Thermoanaerobaculia bacterium]
MSNEKLLELRQFLIEDAYAHAYLVCRHRDLDPRIHMPVAYAAAGQASKLAWCITQSGYEGYTINMFREACASRGIDPSTLDGVYKLDTALDWVNIRLPRGWFKSSVITHAGVSVTATRDPNNTIKITAALDDKAWELTQQIGETALSGIYNDLFPDRVPTKRDVTKDKIRFGGRTISHRQTTVQSDSYQSKEAGGHYDHFFTDDLVVGGPRGNAKPHLLPGVETWLSGAPGMFMLTRRVRLVHAGTRWAENDDHGWLTFKRRAKQCVSIVVPIEIHDGEVVNILQRGIPTEPTFYSLEKIQAWQDRTLTDESEIEGAENWRCNALLAPSAASGRVFPEEVVDDLYRTWLGPFDPPDGKVRANEPQRFLIGRFARDEQARPLALDGTPLDDKTEGWASRAKVIVADPWVDLDVIAAVHTGWGGASRRWATVCVGVDSDLIEYVIEAKSGEDSDGWIAALHAADATYKIRAIGMDSKAYKDSIVENLRRIDTRVRSFYRKIAPVDQPERVESSRVRAAIAEPLKMYKLMMLPGSDDPRGDYGASLVRNEMKRYRDGTDDPWPVLEALSMVRTLMRAVMTREQKDRMRTSAEIANMKYKRAINPRLGVPNA